ncbi:MAG TPA: glycosyltransferase [archaeon]|nr:glycosyltransferase [archaeon]
MSRHVGLVIGQLGYGGAERQLTFLARGLRERGEHVSVFCLSQELEPYGEEIRQGGIPLFALPRRGHRELERVFRLARLLRREKPDILHSFLETGNIYSFLARPLAGNPAFIPSVRSILPYPGGALKRNLHGRSLKAADLVLANCQASAEAFARIHSLRPECFRIIHNGVPEFPAFDKAAREKARQRFKIPKGHRVIGTVGKDAPRKNIPAYIKLAGKLYSKLGDICALAAGRGLDESYPARHDLRRTAVCQAIFLGLVKDIATFYAALDIFVLTSLSEGLPNGVLEAMAAGLPVVAYDVGGVAELVEDQATGILVPQDDEEALYEAVYSLLGDRDLARKLGEAGKRRASERFTVDRMVGEILALYEEIREKQR